MAGRTIALTVPRVNPSKTDKTHPTGRFRRNILSPHVFDLPAYSEDGTKKPPGKMPGGWLCNNRDQSFFQAGSSVADTSV